MFSKDGIFVMSLKELPILIVCVNLSKKLKYKNEAEISRHFDVFRWELVLQLC